MDRACGMHGAEEKCIQSFGGETLRKETVWLVWVGGEYCALTTQDGIVWIGLIWLKIGTCGWLW